MQSLSSYLNLSDVVIVVLVNRWLYQTGKNKDDAIDYAISFLKKKNS